MQLNKKDINVFIGLWLESDPILWANFSDTQREILKLRIIKEYSFKEIAKKFKVDELLAMVMFQTILAKVEKIFDIHLTVALYQINKNIDMPKVQLIEVDLNQIHLN